MQPGSGQRVFAGGSKTVHEDRNGAVGEHFLRFTSQQQCAYTLPAMGGHEYQVAPFVFGGFDDGLIGLLAVYGERLAGNTGCMAGRFGLVQIFS